MPAEQLKAVLTAVGLPEDKFNEIMNLPEDKVAEFKADEYVSALRGSVENQIKNDARFWESLDENNVGEALKTKIEKAQFNRVSNIARQKIQKALGLSDEDIADMPEETKAKYETYVAALGEKYSQKGSNDKQLQKELMEARKRLETLEASAPELEKKYKEQYETASRNDKIDMIILAELASIDGSETHKLKVPASYFADKIAKELKDSYTLNLNGFKIDAKQKQNPNLSVLDGSKEMTTRDLIVKILQRDNLIEDRKPQKDGPQRGKVSADADPKDGTFKISSHIADKIKANMEE